MDNRKVFDLEKTRNSDEILALLGVNDENLKLIENRFNVRITVENNEIFISGNAEAKEVTRVFDRMLALYRSKRSLDQQDVVNVLNNDTPLAFFHNAITRGVGSKSFYLRTAGQKKLFDAFATHDITIVTGPAGTGKTFLAVVFAANKLREGTIRKIIITRPVVEAGESLGYLPGDLKEKVDPYLIPIYDSLDVLFGHQNVERMMEKGVIEVAPLAYMRGRTLNDAVVILDEAQNTTSMQIKMFLTRLGFNSKMIITGDITQIDLPASRPSGLVSAIKIVEDIPEIAVIEMSRNDVVRHPVVQKIIDAYEISENRKK